MNMQMVKKSYLNREKACVSFNKKHLEALTSSKM